MALSLVHQGWDHLQRQRPQAAWAAWQQALRVIPDDPAATQALEALSTAQELPAAARAVYKFLPPRGEERRVRWDDRLRGRDLGRLDDAAGAFAGLAVEDPSDAEAAYNEGLCLAWLGRNPEAIAALDRAVGLLAGDQFDRAVDAWTLAEVLRPGGGAEHLADDLRFAWIIEGAGPDLIDRLADRAALVPMPTPVDPATGQPSVDADIFEWLDRPLTAGAEGLDSADDLPRVLATVIRTPRSLRLSSPDPSTLDAVLDPLTAVLGTAGGDLDLPIRREAAPLPLSLLDAALWTIRVPRGLEPGAEQQLTRLAVESGYEDRWIHVPRQGLGGRSPLEAAGAAGDDPDVRARLTAVVRLREQLGARPTTARLYQGYPFDRLRRRLGLELVDPASVEPDDPSCMSGAELDRLDPSALDDLRLADAFASASGLRDDRCTARFAAEIARRPSAPPGRIDLTALFAPLVREAMSAHDPDAALAWLDRAIEWTRAAGRDPRTFAIWAAEIHARSGDPDASLGAYEALLERVPSDASLALDAAMTLLDNGHDAHARPLLLRARDEARKAGDAATEERAQTLINETLN